MSFESKVGTLVEFWLRFESAMNQQRHTQKKLENDNKHTCPKTSTHQALEAHGAKVYTYKVLQEFQQEVKYLIDTCRSRGFAEEDTVEVNTVKDTIRDMNYEVTYIIYGIELHLCKLTFYFIVDAVIFKASCSYRMLERKGILCRHVICIYLSNGLKTIPDEYVAKRWSKDAIRSGMFNCNGEATEDIDIIDGQQIAMSITWSEVHHTVGMLMGRWKADVKSFSTLIRESKEKLSPIGAPLSKQQ
ncbi:protein FAR1-RELATED SEQUENCE 5-like [Silene latifolia]|uniref:protein FAR1-RELATED SEQUENCE 5-like n=1 Tax=Silene latifolia TaxID=37657 RepID=UPI003D776F8D